jgi:hypothetical protein
MKRAEVDEGLQEPTPSRGPYAYACAFYGIEPALNLSNSTHAGDVPFSSVFEDLVDLSSCFARHFIQNMGGPPRFREGFALTLHLIEKLVASLKTPITISWDPSKWLSAVLEVLNSQVCCIPLTIIAPLSAFQAVNFATVDRIISLAVVLHQATGIAPNLSIQERPVMHAMITRVCALLHVSWLP